MKFHAAISYVFLFNTAFSQTKVNFYAIDQKVRSIEISSPEILARELVSGCSTELDKVSSIFYWVANHIEYNTSRFGWLPKGKYKSNYEPVDTGEIKPLDERVAESVLRCGYAVCDGYARLFKTLCDYAGIKNKLITGYARTNRGHRRFGSNHTWNAVLINNKWELMDVTWASGYIGWSDGQFVPDFDEYYFMTPPAKFIEEHYPDNIQWTLMTNPPLMDEFRNSPFKQKDFLKYNFRSYSPSKGVVEATIGDTLYFVLQSSNPARDGQITPDFSIDTASFTATNCVLIRPQSIVQDKITYSYCAISPSIEWIYLIYNDDIVLRYRLNLKNSNNGLSGL